MQVWEWSPNHGLSTIFILAALADNGHGQLIAFDVNENWHDSEACMGDQIEGRFRFVLVSSNRTTPLCGWFGTLGHSLARPLHDCV